MGQKSFEAAGFDDASKVEFVENMKDGVEDIKGGLLKKGIPEKKLAMRYLRQKFTCEDCEISWTTHFKVKPYQDCKDCKKAVKGEIVLPEGSHFVGTIRCKKCEITWTRPILPKKTSTFKCFNCKMDKCPVIKFGIDEGEFLEEFEKYKSRKHKIREKTIKQYEKHSKNPKVKKKDDADEDEHEGEEQRVDQMEILKKLEEMDDDRQDGNESTLCRICFDNAIRIIAIPCGHPYCASCFDKIGKDSCAFCRREIESGVTMFL